MGFYIDGPASNGKAGYIIREHGATRIARPHKFSDVPEGKALIAVINNFHWDAALFVHDEWEWRRLADSALDRPIEYLLMDRALAEKLTKLPANPREVM